MPFVEDVLTSRDRHDHFDDPASVKEQSQWNQRQPFLESFLGKLVQLASVDQQLSGSFGFVVPETGLAILSDVSTDQPKLIFLDPHIGFIERDAAFAKAFDFASNEHHTAFDLLKDLVLVSRTPVLGDNLTLIGRAIFRCLFLFLLFAGHKREI